MQDWVGHGWKAPPLVTIRLTPRDDGTLVELFHHGFEATGPEHEVRDSMVGDLTDTLFGGNTAALVSHLLTEHDIAPGDLARVKQLIAAHEDRARKEKDDAR